MGHGVTFLGSEIHFSRVKTSRGIRFPMNSNRRDIQLLHKRFLIPLAG